MYELQMTITVIYSSLMINDKTFVNVLTTSGDGYLISISKTQRAIYKLTIGNVFWQGMSVIKDIAMISGLDSSGKLYVGALSVEKSPFTFNEIFEL